MSHQLVEYIIVGLKRSKEMMRYKGSRSIAVKIPLSDYQNLLALSTTLGVGISQLARVAVLLALEPVDNRYILDVNLSDGDVVRGSKLRQINVVLPNQLYDAMYRYCNGWRKCTPSTFIRASIKAMLTGRLTVVDHVGGEVKSDENDVEVELIVPHLRGGELEKTP